jgi:UDP-glucose 4-epimerase
MAATILATWGADCIGGVVASQVLTPGYEVIVSDRSALDSLVQKYSVDAVMHFAAAIEAGESTQMPEKYFRNHAWHWRRAHSDCCGRETRQGRYRR